MAQGGWKAAQFRGRVRDRCDTAIDSAGAPRFRHEPPGLPDRRDLPHVLRHQSPPPVGNPPTGSTPGADRSTGLVDGVLMDATTAVDGADGLHLAGIVTRSLEVAEPAGHGGAPAGGRAGQPVRRRRPGAGVRGERAGDPAAGGGDRPADRAGLPPRRHHGAAPRPAGDAGRHRRGLRRGRQGPVRDRRGPVPVRDPSSSPCSGPATWPRRAGGRSSPSRRWTAPASAACWPTGCSPSEDTFGALNLYSRERDAFDDDAVAVGTILAAHAALAFARAREREQISGLEQAVAQQPGDRHGDRHPDGDPADRTGRGVRSAAEGEPADQPQAAGDRGRGCPHRTVAGRPREITPQRSLRRGPPLFTVGFHDTGFL